MRLVFVSSSRFSADSLTDSGLDGRFASTYNGAARIYVLTMKTNITLKLDAEVLREARILAAEEGSSISGLLAAKLEELVQERKGYDRARNRALGLLPTAFASGLRPSPSTTQPLSG